MRLGAPIPIPDDLDDSDVFVRRGDEWLAYDDVPSSPVARIRCGTCTRFYEPSREDWQRDFRTCPHCEIARATKRLASYPPEGVTYHADADGLSAGFPGWDESLADEAYEQFIDQFAGTQGAGT